MIRKQMTKNTVAKRTSPVLKEDPITPPSAGRNRLLELPALYLPTGRPFRPDRDNRPAFEPCTACDRGESPDVRKRSTCCEGSNPSDRAPSSQAQAHG